MIEPVALSNFFLSFFAAALIILTATVYVSLYAWAEIKNKQSLRYWAWFVYFLLLGCVTVFVQVMNLNGYWQIIAVMMAIGYWWMPRLILRLCIATHTE